MPARHHFRNAFIGIDQQGLIKKWDQQAEKIFGWTAKEATGRRIGDLIITPEDRASYIKSSTKFLNDYSSKALTSEVDALDREGHVFPIELIVAPLPDGHKSSDFTAVVRDISPVIEAERLKGLLSAIDESSRDPIIALMPEGAISSWNASAEELFGYKSDEAVGQNIDIILTPEQQENTHEIIKRVLA